MTDQTLDHVILRCRGCQAAYPAALEYACSRCLGPLDPEYDAEVPPTPDAPASDGGGDARGDARDGGIADAPAGQ